jgi:hypothetical protein
MSLVTYVLLCALGYGTAGKFDTEVIPDVTTKCMVTQILEVLIIRFGLYMMQAPVPFLDLFSYTGYKYLGLCINMLGWHDAWTLWIRHASLLRDVHVDSVSSILLYAQDHGQQHSIGDGRGWSQT